MPGSRLEVFEQAGHFLFLDDPGQFTRALNRFFADTEPAWVTTSMMRELVLARDPSASAVLKRLPRDHPSA